MSVRDSHFNALQRRLCHKEAPHPHLAYCIRVSVVVNYNTK